MADQPAFDVNLAFRLAKMSSGGGGGGGGSAAHMPIPGGEGENHRLPIERKAEA